MTEQYFPTEQELDALLEYAPVFDPETVKRNVLAHAEGEPVHPRRRKLPVRGLLIAAVVCVLLGSVIAAADYVSGGRVIRSLMVPKQPQQIVETEPEVVLDEETEEKPSVVQPLPKPVEQPAEPTVLPELDEQIAEALQVTPVQKETLRPAVQNVEQTAEHQDIRMTVLQTVGDPGCLYVKLRFDFPVDVAQSDEAKFDKIKLSLDRSQAYSWNYTVLERDARSVVYLLQIKISGDENLNGQTVTLHFENYGQPIYIEDFNTQFELSDGEPYTMIVDPNGNIRGDVTAEDVAALPSAADTIEEREDGFTVWYMTDGTQVATYDGNHGIRYMTVLRGEKPRILTGDNPLFKTVLEGSWSQSWQLSYEDTSLYWQGEESVIDPTMTMTEFRISPLSCSVVFNYQTYIPYTIHEEWNMQLLCEDGTKRELVMRRTSYFGDNTVFPVRFTQTQVFDTPLDLTGVKAVIIDGKEFPLS